MKINIDELSESELIDLNSRIVERLRFLGQARTHSKMLEFGIGNVWPSRQVETSLLAEC